MPLAPQGLGKATLGGAPVEDLRRLANPNPSRKEVRVFPPTLTGWSLAVLITALLVVPRGTRGRGVFTRSCRGENGRSSSASCTAHRSPRAARHARASGERTGRAQVGERCSEKVLLPRDAHEATGYRPWRALSGSRTDRVGVQLNRVYHRASEARLKDGDTRAERSSGDGRKLFVLLPARGRCYTVLEQDDASATSRTNGAEL